MCVFEFGIMVGYYLLCLLSRRGCVGSGHIEQVLFIDLVSFEVIVYLP